MLNSILSFLPSYLKQKIEIELEFLHSQEKYQDNFNGIETTPLKLYLPIESYEEFKKEFSKNEEKDCFFVFTLPQKNNNQKTIHNLSLNISFLQKKFILEKNLDFTLENNQLILSDSHNIEFSCLLQTASLASRWPHLNYHINCKSLLQKPDKTILRYYIHQILLGRKPSVGLKLLDKHGVLEEILPELVAGKNLNQNRFHEYDIYEHSLHTVDNVQNADIILRWSGLLHDIGKVPTRKEKENGEASFHNHEMFSYKMTIGIMKRLGISRQLGQQITFLIRNHMFHYTAQWTDKAVKRFVKKINPSQFDNLIQLRLADRKGSGKKNDFPVGLQKLIKRIDVLHHKDKELKVKDLKISGHDIMNLNIPAGPLIGTILQELLKKVKNNQILNESEELLQYVKNNLIETC